MTFRNKLVSYKRIRKLNKSKLKYSLAILIYFFLYMYLAKLCDHGLIMFEVYETFLHTELVLYTLASQATGKCKCVSIMIRCL